MEQIPEWRAMYPVGGTIVLPDLKTGVDVVYTIVSTFIDDHSTFHPSTSVAVYRCSALLRPVA